MPPLLVRRQRRERPEHLARGAVVDVLAAAEGVDQRLVLGEVREDPQLDLAVVGGEQHVPRFGHEGLADAPALRGADGDVLQVRVADGEPAGGGDGLVERRVDAAGLEDRRARQGVDVGGLELLDAPGSRGSCGAASWASASSSSTSSAVDAARVLAVFLAERKPEAVEQDLAELDRRVDVELALARAWISFVRAVSCCSMSRLMVARCDASTLTPATSMSARISLRGSSSFE